MKLIIAGSRNITDDEILRQAMFEFCKMIHKDKISMPLNSWIDEIISGAARGIDTLGERFADKHLIDKTIMPANWLKHGKSAGYRRNERMAKYGTHLLAIPESLKSGTKHMIDLANKHNLVVFVYDKCIKDES